MMTPTTQIEENADFQQMSLPLELGSGERVLLFIRLEAESTRDAWYELYLVVTPNGFLIEKHSGSALGHGRQKETWFRRTLPQAEHKYSLILNGKLNQKRKSPRKYQVVNCCPPTLLRQDGNCSQSLISDVLYAPRIKANDQQMLLHEGLFG